MSDLKPCPFCGGGASIERYGDRRRSTIYQCDNCSCSLETGEEWGHGGDWNRRADTQETSRISALEKENAELRKALEETAEVLNLMDSEGVRAATFNNVPEDGLIRELCERIGYGAVMDSAARQWFKKDSVGAITTGTCAGTLRNLKAVVRSALRYGGEK